MPHKTNYKPCIRLVKIFASGHSPVDLDRFPNHVKIVCAFTFLQNISHLLYTH